MECLFLLSVCVALASGLTIAELRLPGSQIPGAANITLLDVTPTKSLPAVCEEASCFPKCCPFGQSLINKTCTPTDYPFEPEYTPGDNLKFSIFDEPSLPFYMIIGEICSGEDRFPMNPDEFVLLFNGTMVIGEMDENGTFMLCPQDSKEKSWFGPNEYCLDSLLLPGSDRAITVAVLCAEETQLGGIIPFHIKVYPIGILLSVCFLLLTMGVYLAVPDLRDLQGMSLICHLICHSLAYTFLAAVQLSSEGFGETGCAVVAYAIQLLFSGSFFWLNVMCFDATWSVIVATLPEKDPEGEPKWWWKLHYPGAKVWVKVGKTFMTGREERDEKTDLMHKQKERRFKIQMFIVYSCYAWFFSLLPVVLVLIQKFGPIIPNTYLQYNMVSYNCNFQDLSDKNSLPYFYTPIGTILIINFVMFILMLARSCNYPWNPKGPHRIPRQKARMCFMLFFLMAMNWLTDLISWAYKGEAFTFNVLNVFNILQGVITFCIFILEDRVKLLIVKKLWPNLKSLGAKYGCCDVEQPQEATESTERDYMLRNYNQQH